MNLPNKLTLWRIILVPFFVAALLIPFPLHTIVALTSAVLLSGRCRYEREKNVVT